MPGRPLAGRDRGCDDKILRVEDGSQDDFHRPGARPLSPRHACGRRGEVHLPEDD